VVSSEGSFDGIRERYDGRAGVGSGQGAGTTSAACIRSGDRVAATGGTGAFTEMFSMQSPATGHLAFQLTLGREKRGYGRRPEQRNQAPAGELKNQAREWREKLHAAITISDHGFATLLRHGVAHKARSVFESLQKGASRFFRAAARRASVVWNRFVRESFSPALGLGRSCDITNARPGHSQSQNLHVLSFLIRALRMNMRWLTAMEGRGEQPVRSRNSFDAGHVC
jgi:hypothetical protein